VSNTDVQDRFLAQLDQHRKIVHKVASSYSRTAADRDDLSQEIIAQLWTAFPRYDKAYRFSTWMYRIALNVAISSYRRDSVRSRHVVQADEAVLRVAAPEEHHNERVRELYALIQSLNDMDRALVILYLDGHRYEEIAEVLGISESNVGTRLNRIKTRLRADAARTT
jgi:RNA polymerase sigma-70 factor, ECF subfamily